MNVARQERARDKAVERARRAPLDGAAPALILKLKIGKRLRDLGVIARHPDGLGHHQTGGPEHSAGGIQAAQTGEHQQQSRPGPAQLLLSLRAQIGAHNHQ